MVLHIDDSQFKTQQASIKALTAGLMVDLGTYYSDERNIVSFDQNSIVKSNIQSKLATLNLKFPGNYQYVIIEERQGDIAIKVGELQKGIYVCSDTKTIKVVDITEQDFAKRTDCSGVALAN